MQRRVMDCVGISLVWATVFAFVLLWGYMMATAADPASVTLKRLTINGVTGVDSNSTASFDAIALFSDGTTQTVTADAVWTLRSAFATVSGGVLTASSVTKKRRVAIRAAYTFGRFTRRASKLVTIAAAGGANPPAPGPVGGKSITSTSQNRATAAGAAVPEQPFVNQNGFAIFSANDLGMHCGDLDHRVASILPPFNVLHSMVIQKGANGTSPEILTPIDVDVLYSAASNPNDPALLNPRATRVFKTNFWDPNPVAGGSSLAFDAYDPFYPPGVLSQFPLGPDVGLPVPDVAELYPVAGAGRLVAEQQDMPGVSAPFSANAPQLFKRFDTDLPFFVNFPFGYRLTAMNWFAADGIPVAPFDDSGRKNSFPLVRVQARTKTAGLTGSAGEVFASVDSVIPVSAESDCFRCHVSSGDGGGGQAACVPGVDASCAGEGSPRSGTPFNVVRASEDKSNVPAEAKREWAADSNILRLHDAKHGTQLQASTPVVCQTCHYTPALDLAHVGPMGPGDADANGREQRIHRTNSRVMHAFHGQFTDLFVDDLPPPTDQRRIDRVTGKPIVNAFVQDKLNQSCYQCHPGRETKCLRGAMFNGGLVCQDCHGGMQQVGNDFSQNFSTATPFPAGADLTKRIPWADVPACQSCHTGDAVSNLGLSDPNVVRSSDGIRLLQAYRSNDTANAKPIVATNKRFAENDANGRVALYRVSKGHSGVFCEACHGSTHAEWPVQPESGASISNDNMAAIQLQGHTGTITECTACHAAGSLPVSLGGPHGMHPVGQQNFVNGHDGLAEGNQDACRACHGQNGEGTVLSRVSANRTVSAEGRQIALTKGQQVTCTLCHGNEL
ncbi:MAG: hypothetical protein AB9873_07915 [Syntrophobacteraceae bacterium]